MFQVAPPLISQGCALPASPEGKLLYRDFGCRVYRHAPGKLQENLPRRGRGTARRRWMRGGTALSILGTTGAEVDLPSLTVGNGLCAVPPRCSYNLCGQPEPPPRHVIPSGVKRSRGIFPSCKFYLVVVLCPTWWIPPLRLRSRPE